MPGGAFFSTPRHLHVLIYGLAKSMILSNRIIQYRLASSEEARLVESRDAVTAKLSIKCLAKFRKDIEEQERMMTKLKRIRYKPEMFYSSVFLPKVQRMIMHITTCTCMCTLCSLKVTF